MLELWCGKFFSCVKNNISNAGHAYYKALSKSAPDLKIKHQKLIWGFVLLAVVLVFHHYLLEAGICGSQISA